MTDSPFTAKTLPVSYQNPADAPRRAGLRGLPVLVIVALYWAGLFVSRQLELAQFEEKQGNAGGVRVVVGRAGFPLNSRAPRKASLPCLVRVGSNRECNAERHGFDTTGVFATIR